MGGGKRQAGVHEQAGACWWGPGGGTKGPCKQYHPAPLHLSVSQLSQLGERGSHYGSGMTCGSLAGSVLLY